MDKAELQRRIDELERKRLWHLDVADDPETYVLMPSRIDYLNEKLSSRIKTKIANIAATRFFDNMIAERKLVIKEVRGIENFRNVKGGCIVTCNHFSISDHYAVWTALRESMGGRMLYKVIREGNYTNPPKPFGLFMRHCNTLPLSSHRATMAKFLDAVRVLLSRGETILIYPEQGLWWDYKKPRPMQDGAFSLAVKNKVPVVPIFITTEETDPSSAPAYTLHVLPAIYPDESLPQKDARLRMKDENYKAWVKVYEEFYNIPLEYKL